MPNQFSMKWHNKITELISPTVYKVKNKHKIYTVTNNPHISI